MVLEATSPFVGALGRIHPLRYAGAAFGLAWSLAQYGAYRRRVRSGTASAAEARAWRVVEGAAALLLAGLALFAVTGDALPAGAGLLVGGGAILAGTVLWVVGHVRVARASRTNDRPPVT